MSGILLTGGTGFVGGHLRAVLRDRPVVLLGRRCPPLRENERWIYVDLSDQVKPRQLTGGEALCHLAYSRADGSKNVSYNRRLLDAVNACPTVRHVLLLSSISVYGRVASSVVDEESICDPMGEYAESKLDCEKVWLAGLREDCALTILRPTEVIGPGGEGLVSLIRDAVHRPLLGTVRRSILYYRPLHYVAVSNVVAAINFCLVSPLSGKRRVFIVSDDRQPQNESYAAMQDYVRGLLGKRELPSLPLPRWALDTLGKATGHWSTLEQRYSSQKIRDAGFREVVPLGREIRRVVESLEGHVV